MRLRAAICEHLAKSALLTQKQLKMGVDLMLATPVRLITSSLFLSIVHFRLCLSEIQLVICLSVYCLYILNV